MNEITITGNLVYAPSLRTAGTQQMTKFRLAHNHSYRDTSTGNWVDNGTTYVDVTCWRTLAENVVASLEKGAAVIVTGRLRAREREIEIEDGKREKRTFFEIEASAIGPDLTRGATQRQERRGVGVDRQENSAIDEAFGSDRSQPSGSPLEPVPGAEVPAA